MKKFEDIFYNEVKHWTGDDVINALFGMSHDKLVYFADTTIETMHNPNKFPVNDFFSWRGSYSDPSISSIGSEVYTSTELIVALNEFFDSIQEGWKGGEFNMDSSRKLWCDPEGEYHGKGVANVIECEDAIYIVVGRFK